MRTLDKPPQTHGQIERDSKKIASWRGEDKDGKTKNQQKKKKKKAQAKEKWINDFIEWGKEEQ